MRYVQDDAEYVPGGVKLADGKAPKRFIPFGEGQRNCVGQTLARLNLTTAIAQLYGSFTFRLASEVTLPIFGASLCGQSQTVHMMYLPCLACAL